MSVQDDVRENELIALFGLRKADTSRGGIDAVLDHSTAGELPFELKSTTTGSVTTVRDFGPDHIQKWTRKHWLIGVYENGVSNPRLLYTIYSSPSQMADWIETKRLYIQTDFDLAEIAPDHLTLEDLHIILGEKESYDYYDAKRLHKRQYSRTEYRENADLPGECFSPSAMLEILKARCAYLIRRGSTLNNPHIPASYFRDFEKITESHQDCLSRLVDEYLSSAPA